MTGGKPGMPGPGGGWPPPNSRLNTFSGLSSGFTSWPLPMNETAPEPFSKFEATPSCRESKGSDPFSF